MSSVFPITDDPRYRRYTASAGQTTFPIPFPFLQDEDLGIYRQTAPSEYVLFSPETYVLSGAGDPEGGTLTFNSPRAADDIILILGEAILDRLSSIVKDGRFSSSLIDSELDRVKIIEQEFKRDARRAMKVDYGGASVTLAADLADGDVLMKQGNRLVQGPNVDQIANAQSFAEQAEEAMQATEQAALIVGSLLSAAFQVSTIAAFESINIPDNFSVVRTVGYYLEGDGGHASYSRASAEPVHAGKVKSADGAWWELRETTPNILMFGARPGSILYGNSNVVAINSAIDYLSTIGGGKLAGAAGTFYVNSELRLDGLLVVFDGESKSTTVKATADFTDTQVFAIAGNGNQLRNLVIDCSALTSNVWLSGVRVEDGSTVDCGVSGCEIKDASFCGIWMSDGAGAFTHTRFFAEKNYITNVAWVGISFEGVVDGRIDGNTVKTAGYVGITLQDRCINTKITKNYVNKANPPYRFYTGPGSIGGVEGGFLIGYAPSNRNTLIDGNICEDNRNAHQDGIGLGEDGTEHGVCIISNNIVIHAGLFGIDVASNSTVIGNRIIEPAFTGIFMALDLGGVIRNSMVANNTVLNCNGPYGMQITNSFGAPVLVQDCIISGNVFSDLRSSPTMQYGIRVYRASLTINNLQIVNNEAVNLTSEGFINDGSGSDWPIFVQGNRWRNQMKSVTGTFSVTGYEAFSVSNASGGALRLFTGGYEGKEISVYFSDGNTTIYPDWANTGGYNENRIIGLGNVSRAMAAGDMATFRYRQGVGWQITGIVDVS